MPATWGSSPTSFFSWSSKVATEQPLGPRLVAGLLEGVGEVATADEPEGVVGAQLGLAQLQRLFVQPDRLRRAARLAVGLGEVVAAGQRIGVVVQGQ